MDNRPQTTNDTVRSERTNPILDPPRSLLVVGLDDVLAESTRSALRDGEAAEVHFVDTFEAATGLLDTRKDIGCVLSAAELPKTTCGALCDAVRSVHEDLPVVVVFDPETAQIDPAAFRAGVAATVPADAEFEELLEVVDEVLVGYVDRRQDAENREMFDALMTGLGEAIYFKDANARHVRISRVPGGLEPENAKGKTDVELYGEDIPDAAREAYEDDMRVINDESPVVNRIERIGSDHDLWMRTTKIPWVDDDGRRRGLFGLTINVTEYKQIERDYEEISKRFDSFTSRLGHDIKTPLQVASGSLEMALESGDPDMIERAQGSIERAEQILHDYETLSKQARDTSGNAPAVELGTLVREVWESLECEESRLEVDFLGRHYVNATEEMVRPVVENLLKNAVAHNDPPVTVRAGLTEDGFYVEDTGDGIPEEDRQKVLEEGYTTSQDGSGRGLSIVMNEMEKHVWSLGIGESSEGGARFQIDECRALLETPPEIADDEPFEIDGTAAVGDLDWGGHAEYVEEFDQWHVTSDGVEIYRQDNEFYYAFKTVEGPTTILGRVVGVEYVDDFSKGGFMVRDSLSPDASYAYIGQTPGHGSQILYREDTGENGLTIALEDDAFTFGWYRIDREGDEVRLSLSMDGDHWQPIQTLSIAFDDPVHVGMLTCSCVPGRPCEVTFEQVRSAQHHH